MVSVSTSYKSVPSDLENARLCFSIVILKQKDYNHCEAQREQLHSFR